MRFTTRRSSDIDLRLDLGWVRREVGEKWERVAPSVFRFTERTIVRNLGARASYSISGDGYLIRVRGMGRSVAVRRLEKIEKELAILLFGSGTSGDIAFPTSGPRARKKRRRRRLRGWFNRIKSFFRLDSGDGTSDRRAQPADDQSDPAVTDSPAVGESDEPAPQVDSSDVDEPSSQSRSFQSASRRAGRVDPGRQLQDRGSRSVAGSSMAARPLAHDVGRHLQEVELGESVSADDLPSVGETRPDLTAPETFWRGRSEFDFDFADAVPRSSRSAKRVRWDETKALELSLAAAAEKAEKEAGAMRTGEAFPPNGLKLLFRPMWFVQRDVLSIFTCLPAAASGPFEFLTGDALLPPMHEQRHLVMLDFLLLKEVIAQIREIDSDAIKTLLYLSVHYETLTGPEGSAYRELIAALPQSTRKLIVLEIVNISRGAGQVGTQSLILKMRSLVRAVVGRLDLPEANFALWRNTDLSFVGLDLEGDDRPEGIILREIERFANGAHQEGLTTYIRGVRTRSLVTAALMNGFVYIEGPAVSDGDLELPVGARKFHLTDIYAPLARKTALENARTL